MNNKTLWIRFRPNGFIWYNYKPGYIKILYICLWQFDWLEVWESYRYTVDNQDILLGKVYNENTMSSTTTK